MRSNSTTTVCKTGDAPGEHLPMCVSARRRCITSQGPTQEVVHGGWPKSRPVVTTIATSPDGKRILHSHAPPTAA